MAAGLATGLVLTIAALGRRQFGAGDYGSIAAHAWALHLGYAPYREVVTAYPPLFLLGAKAGFAVFGVRWLAMVWMAALFSGATFLLQAVLLAKNGLRPAICLGVSLAVQIVSMLPLSTWSYNPESAVCAALFLSAVAWLHAAPRENAARAALVATGALLATCKPNVAGIVLPAAAILLAFSADRASALACLVVAGVLAALALVILGFDLAAMVRIYAQVSHARLAPGGFSRLLWWADARFEVPNTLAALAPIAVAMGFSLAAASRPRAPVFRAGLALVGLIAMLASWITDHEFKMSATPPFLVAGALWLLSESSRSRRALVTTSLVLLSTYGLILSVQRKRVLAIGEHEFYESGPLAPVTNPPFFAGVLAAPPMFAALDALDAELRARGYAQRSDAPVFFGPRLEFAYAAWGIHPIRRLPLLWDFYPDGDPRTVAALRLFEENPPDLCVLLVSRDDDMTSWPPSLRELLRERYTSRVSGPLRLLERRR